MKRNVCSIWRAIVGLSVIAFLLQKPGLRLRSATLVFAEEKAATSIPFIMNGDPPTPEGGLSQVFKTAVFCRRSFPPSGVKGEKVTPQPPKGAYRWFF